jgi:hypothetical protein
MDAAASRPRGAPQILGSRPHQSLRRAFRLQFVRAATWAQCVRSPRLLQIGMAAGAQTLIFLDDFRWLSGTATITPLSR